MADRLSVNLVHEVNIWAKTFVLPEFSELNNLCATAELESKYFLACSLYCARHKTLSGHFIGIQCIYGRKNKPYMITFDAFSYWHTPSLILYP